MPHPLPFDPENQPAALSDGMQSLDQACVELHRMVDAFRAQWQQGHAANAEQFPLELVDGDWFEAFLSSATTGDGL